MLSFLALPVLNLNGPEYEARKNKPFVPPHVKIEDLNKAIPKHLFKPDTKRGMSYVVRDLGFSIGLLVLASRIDPLVASMNHRGEWTCFVLATVLWCLYWFFQSLVAAGIFCLGHEAGHGSLTRYRLLNDTIGFSLHSVLLIPYFSWKITHHAHHRATGSLENDENYVPKTRQRVGLPPASTARRTDYADIFEETPLFTLFRVFVMQAVGWWMYLSFNTLGSPKYPEWTTNHFQPSSPLFKDTQAHLVILSDCGVAAMAFILDCLCRQYTFYAIFKFYVVPYLLMNHWIVMFTFLHHSDPTIPHYRHSVWTKTRGALATVDRPLLGWMGRFFLHNISHDHVAHHLFLKVPFYNGPEVTRYIKAVLKDDYNYDSTNSFYALWRSFNECQFIEEDECIVFYKNRHGECARTVAQDLGSFQECSTRCSTSTESDDEPL
ncbi:delta-12 fatty acid desaturase [Sistotremastrum suecicum HHB10207 ss-3]|uniref:Delta-12 fatty acid desaturase n=1 Tax=Sistotremastrum suecicum HHB10207 ss-3 TaxID=1314776 RepID=A0A166HAY6_9AGAM|nr:delta-12 fatty acid desaturase [Sistotremastrum suecicum HHB10207 ss-3]